MKVKRVKKWVKNAFIASILITLLVINKRLTNNFIDKCTDKGYSYSYCVEHS